ncbi:MAG: hypothetical protein ISS45_06955 [Candidatus Omnitrophica bacterium]|nr:hypothetical protein [Candidatus Omnitrophota bacterium]
MKKLLVATALLGLSFLFGSMWSVSLAQEEEETEYSYSWGTVSSVSSNRIVVSEYDYDSAEEVSVTYTVDPNVTLKNADSLKDIAVGDNLDIEYVVKNGKKVAKIITVEKSSEGEYTPSETDEEESDYPSEEVEY